MAKGGKRPGAGRPRNDPPTKPCRVYLTDEQMRLLRVWGHGDMTAGVRWLIDQAKVLVVKLDQ